MSKRNTKDLRVQRMPAIIYLHGLGSSPEAHKASVFRAFFLERGCRVEVPDLTIPSFENLSVDAAVRCIVDQVRELGRKNDVIVLGSSYGAFLGIQSVEQLSPSERQSIKAMFFFAPLLYPWHEQYGLISPKLERQWVADGVLELPTGEPPRMVPVGVNFLRELQRYSVVQIGTDMAVTLFHGEQDEVVPIEQSKLYVKMCPHVELVAMTGDHGLFEHDEALTEAVWRRMSELLRTSR
jgi:pimeloyl-ACP methyl ester carboxylesterase